jgi:site-specific DNA recombinase
MTPVSAKKGAARYRYYVSGVIFQGRREDAGSVPRVPAPEIEATVVEALKNLSKAKQKASSRAAKPIESHGQLIEGHLSKIIVRDGEIEILLRGDTDSRRDPIVVRWSPPPTTRRREIVVPDGASSIGGQPIRWEARAKLIEGIAKARLWVDDLIAQRIESTAEIAKRDGCSERCVRMMLGLAFLSPAIVQAAVDGSLPKGVGLTRLSNAPARWD